MKNLALKSRIILLFGTQDRFAEEIKRSSAQVSNIINGLRPVWLDSFEKKLWAKKLKCKQKEIFGETK